MKEGSLFIVRIAAPLDDSAALSAAFHRVMVDVAGGGRNFTLSRDPVIDVESKTIGDPGPPDPGHVVKPHAQTGLDKPAVARAMATKTLAESADAMTIALASYVLALLPAGSVARDEPKSDVATDKCVTCGARRGFTRGDTTAACYDTSPPAHWYVG